MKMLIKSVLHNLDQDNIEDSQFRWEYFKYEKNMNTLNMNNPEFAETNEKLGKIYQEKKWY